MFIGVIFLEISDIFRNSSNGDRFRKWENNDEGQEQNGQEKKKNQASTYFDIMKNEMKFFLHLYSSNKCT